MQENTRNVANLQSCRTQHFQVINQIYVLNNIHHNHPIKN